jgi:hypothetical protein
VRLLPFGHVQRELGGDDTGVWLDGRDIELEQRHGEVVRTQIQPALVDVRLVWIERVEVSVLQHLKAQFKLIQGAGGVINIGSRLSRSWPEYPQRSYCQNQQQR